MPTTSRCGSTKITADGFRWDTPTAMMNPDRTGSIPTPTPLITNTTDPNRLTGK